MGGAHAYACLRGHPHYLENANFGKNEGLRSEGEVEVHSQRGGSRAAGVQAELGHATAPQCRLAEVLFVRK